MGKLSESVVTIAVSIIGLAMLAVIVGRNAQTSKVISAMGDAFSKSIKTAVSPVV